MNQVKISVVIPVYNAEEYLDACLASIQDQSMSSFEAIMVDDGSTDSSPLICERYSATDPRFKLIRKPNGGVSSARNAGLEIAQGEYVMFVDSDDVLLPDAMNTLYEASQGRADFVLGGFETYLENILRDKRSPHAGFFEGETLTVFYDRNVVHNGVYLNSPWAKLYSLRIVKERNLMFRHGVSYGEDMLFVHSFLLHADRIAVTAAPVYGYNVRIGSLSSDILSDRHISQLLVLLPEYSALIAAYRRKYPHCKTLAGLYHKDLIGRFVFRILRIFTVRRSEMLTSETLKTVYGYLDADEQLRLFNVRIGQFVNVLLYKIGWIWLSKLYYKTASGIFRLFR